MPASSLLPRHTSLGRSLWATHALWAAALDQWQRSNKNDAPWDGVVFDKLAHLLHLIWNALFEQNKVSFRSVYQSRDGIHGPGPALEGNTPQKRPAFALDVIEQIQSTLGQFPDVHLFSFHTKHRSRKAVRRVKPGREKTWLQVHLSETLDSGFRGNDLRFVRVLTTGLCQLSLKEIRALGTHQTLDGLKKSLEYNAYVHLVPASLQIVAKLGTHGYSPVKSFASLETAYEEIRLKLSHNSNVYAAGRRSLLDAVREDSELPQTVTRVFHGPERIWTPEIVATWQEAIKTLQPVVAYCIGLRSLIPSTDAAWTGAVPVRPRASAEALEAARVAVSLLRARARVDFPDFPVTLEGLDRPRVTGALLSLFESIPGETLYRRVLASAAARHREQ